MKYLVVVESPAKKNKIQLFLNTIPNHSFIVEASFGHIRYFANKIKSIDIKNDFKPTYGIIKEKQKVVTNLKKVKKKVDEVIIATDLDREGEAIGYHIIEVLNLDMNTTKRICFNEITKKAVVDAFYNHRTLNMDLFEAQQARCILDLLIGFEISPLLWKAIQPKLSTGRCQSPAMQLLYEKESDIKKFSSTKTYEITATFKVVKSINATYCKTVKQKDKVIKLLPKLIDHIYKLDNVTEKSTVRSAPPPYITSSVQQDSSSRFGLSPTLTMKILQQLYEKGKITYMRTDSTIISNSFMEAIEKYCNDHYPDYFKKNFFKSKVSNAQEAHECIRPVSLDIGANNLDSSYSLHEKNLYKMIFQRTIASQMKQYSEKHYNYTLVSTSNNRFKFNFTLKQTLFLGYKKVYSDDVLDNKKWIDSIKIGETYKPSSIEAIEKYTTPPSRYTEASLIKELERKGIGRPSTFASIVSKLFQRKYSRKEPTHNYKEVSLEKLSIKQGDTLKTDTCTVKSISEKNKIFMTEIGTLVCNFMATHFKNIHSYDFTSEIESDLDKVANSDSTWTDVTKKVYETFHPIVIKLKSDPSVKKEFKDKKLHFIGIHENKNIYSYLGKYGPCIQIGDQDNKPRYVTIDVSKYPDITKITLEQATELLKYPIKLGDYDNSEVILKKGQYGLYISHGKKNISVDTDTITLEAAIEKIKQKSNNTIKEFKGLKILKGPYGPYIRKGSKNIAIPKNVDASKLTKKECEDIVKNYKPAKYKKY